MLRAPPGIPELPDGVHLSYLMRSLVGAASGESYLSNSLNSNSYYS